MAGINEAVIEEIKVRADLADVIASYGIQIRTVGSSKKVCCPFHNEKTPSFTINDAKGFYHCFGCGESGDVIKFVQKMDGLTFIEAVKRLAEQYGISIEEKEDPAANRRKRLYALMAELAQFYHRCLGKIKEAQLARDYLDSRDLDESVRESFLIGYAPSGIATILKWAEKYKFTAAELEEAGVIKTSDRPGDRGYHRFGGRLMFSIKDKRGRVVAFSGRQLVESKKSGKYVNSPETPIFKKSNVLFGFDKAAANITKSPHREAIVCEGQIDTIRLHISGFPVAVASQGTAFTEEHVNMLKKAADQVVLVFDDDTAGRKATIRTAGLFLAAEMPVRVVSLPGGDDPDSYLRTHSSEEFQRLLDNAESIMSYQVRVETDKEADPSSIDAIARISRAVLGTIAQSKSAVIKAGMVAEAAKLLGLPVVALAEELEKIKVVPPRKNVMQTTLPPDIDDAEFSDDDFVDEDVDSFVEDVAIGPIEGEDAHAVVPPPPRELAFCEFLMANEGDKVVDGMIGEFLPRSVFAHDFTWRFLEAWRAGFSDGGDALAALGETLSPREHEWFDAILLGQTKSGASTLTSTEICQDFVRLVWIDRLKQIRGSLAATGDDNADRKRMKISMDLKRLNSVKWHTVKDLVREWIQEGE
jgi:DNA primase catalytic core